MEQVLDAAPAPVVRSSIRRGDVVLALAFTALGSLLMAENLSLSAAEVQHAVDTGSMYRPVSTDSVWMLPVFWLTTVPLLWWRRSVLGVTAVITAAMALHVLLFGWVTRCGCGLPLMLVLVYLGAVTYERRRAWLTLLAGAALAVATLVRDATTGPDALALALPLALLVFLLGRLVRERTATVRRLRDRNAELERLRDERADLEVALDRERLSVHLDRVVHGRLDQLAERAEDAAGADAAQTRAALMDLEAGGRALLEEMREILGLLRGPDTQFAPRPRWPDSGRCRPCGTATMCASSSTGNRGRSRSPWNCRPTGSSNTWWPCWRGNLGPRSR